MSSDSISLSENITDSSEQSEGSPGSTMETDHKGTTTLSTNCTSNETQEQLSPKPTADEQLRGPNILQTETSEVSDCDACPGVAESQLKAVEDNCQDDKDTNSMECTSNETVASVATKTEPSETDESSNLLQMETNQDKNAGCNGACPISAESKPVDLLVEGGKSSDTGETENAASVANGNSTALSHPENNKDPHEGNLSNGGMDVTVLDTTESHSEEYEVILSLGESELSPPHNPNFPSSYRGAVPYSDTEDSDSSSCYSLSSTSSSSESSSDDEDGASDKQVSNNTEKKESGKTPKPLKVNGELDLVDLPPIEDLHISVPSEQAAEVGKILHIVDTLVVVESYKDQPALDIDSVLFLDAGARPLGRVFDVMGPVSEPVYCVRFNSVDHVKEHNIEPGMLVYCAPQTEHSNFVFLKQLLMMKGSDASWKKDLEVPIALAEYSDDEEEARSRRKVDPNKEKKEQDTSDEPKQKYSRCNQTISVVNRQSTLTPRYRPPSRTRGQMESNVGFRARNPWSWPGQSPNSGQNSHMYQHDGQGPIRPSSFPPQPRHFTQPSRFNAQFQTMPHQPHRTHSEHHQPHQPYHQPQHPYPQPPHPYPQAHHPHPQPTTSFQNSMVPNHNSYSQPPSTPMQGNGYFPPARLPAPAPPSHSHHGYQNQEQQRYNAFNAEITRLVEAYNNGAQTPMSVPPPSLAHPPPPGTQPQYSHNNFDMYSHHSNR